MIIFKSIGYVFLWLLSLITIIVFCIALVVIFKTYKNSPQLDPVVFDMSDRNYGEISEKNPAYMFYVPSRFWQGFQVGYKEAWKDKFFTFYFDLTNFNETDTTKIKDTVFVKVEKAEIDLTYLDLTRNILNLKSPVEVVSNIKIYKESNTDYSDETYWIKGYDNEDVIVFNKYISDEMTVIRKLNSHIILYYKFREKKISELYEVDKKITSFIKNMQIAPESFTRLKLIS